MSLIALGVTGGIGAYKAVEIARGLQSHGHDVVAIMTRGARKFVTPLTFEAITRRRVITDQYASGANADIEHISVASEISLLIVAPATAHVIAKFAQGLADDFLSSLYLATRAPVLIAPAMNTNMLTHDAVEQNLAMLSSRGVHIVEPGEGYLACGWIGKGRLAEPDAVVRRALEVMSPDPSLAGRRVVVTAGPTHEDIDAVRFLGNRSSGLMGYAIAAEAAKRGAAVTLITGPSALEPPPGAHVVRVRRARAMRDAVQASAPGAHAVIMAAAVADFTVEAGAGKIKRSNRELTLTLKPTKDILAELGQGRRENGPVLIGFVAETTDLIARAREKLVAKNVDLMVANDVSRDDSGFESPNNAVTLVSADSEESLPIMPKTEVAARILDRLEQLLATRHLLQVP